MSGVARLKSGYDALTGRVPALATMMKHRDGWQRQIGTLGGGNHFIEVCLDESDRVWVMLHSGSRGIGNGIGRYFIALARERCSPSTRSCRTGTSLGCARARSRSISTSRRSVGRRTMHRRTAPRCSRSCSKRYGRPCRRSRSPSTRSTAITTTWPASDTSARRSTSLERARFGPGPASSGSFRARWARGPTSCAARAARRASTRAPTAPDADVAVAGEENVQRGGSRPADGRGRVPEGRGVVDEIPGAYKDIDAVMANQADLVDVVHTLKQVVCVKG